MPFSMRPNERYLSKRSTSLASGAMVMGTVNDFAGFVRYLARYNSQPADVIRCTLLWH